MTKKIISQQDRNFSISLIQGSKGDIKKTSDFRSLTKFILTNDAIKEKGKLIAGYAENDPKLYKREKSACPGFIIGEFSYRDSNSCLKYEPVIGFDIDHIEDSKQFREIWEKVQRWPFTFVAFPSLSQKGIRLLVYTDSTKERHKDYYSAIAKSLSSLIGFPTKSSIKESLRSLGYPKNKIQQFLETAAHIDDATSDISRFWYYTGLSRSQFFVNQQSEVYQLSEQPTDKQSTPTNTSSSTPSDYLYTFTDEDKIDYLVGQLENRRIDITAGVPEWFKVGLALYDALGDYAQTYFDRVSQFHPDYSSASCNREWDRVKSKYRPGVVSVGTFYRWCNDAGVNLDFKELKRIHADKFVQSEQSFEPNKVLTVQETPDLDAVVIATCIKKPSFIPSIQDVAPKFNAECFSTGDAQIVYSAIEILVRDNMAVSDVSVRAKLKYASKDPELLSQFTVVSPSLDDFLTNIRLLYGQYTKRQFIEVAQNAISEVSEPDIDAIGYVSDFVDEVDSLTDFEANDFEHEGSELALELGVEYKKTVDAKKTNQGAVIGVPTGLTKLDKLTSGFQNTDLIILAARPGMGKTSLALKFAATAAINNGLPVVIFSLEMSAKQLARRIACQIAEVSSSDVKNGQLSGSDLDKFFQALADIESAPIFIYDKPGATASYMRSKVKKVRRKYGVSLVLIDYLQLMGAPTHVEKRGETSTTTFNSKKCKELAKEFDCPVIALSQLSRAVETRGGDKRPQLSDLRESGSIEQDADIVMFIYRPEYYQILEDAEGLSLKGVADILVAKHREGETKDIRVAFESQFTKFWDGVDSEYLGKRADDNQPAFPEPEPEPSYNPSIAAPSKTNDDDDIPF
jgi:replicative DNA helicase